MSKRTRDARGRFEVAPARHCTVEGCTRPHRAHGLCEPHYLRLRNWGDVRPDLPIRGRASRPLKERFMEKVDLSDDGCWLWTAAVTRTEAPYGVFWLDRKQVPAHRVSYEIHVGPIPEGLHLDHLCRNPRCVNPDHLEPVTNAENILRGIGPPAVNAVKTHCDHGHQFTPENTYEYTRNGRTRRSCRACRRENQRRYLERRRSRS